jgi:hypothetical protein
MVTVLEKPVRMTVEDANEKFYPNTYIMVNCEVDLGLPLSGDVYAYAPMKHDGSLTRLLSELSRSKKYGIVDMSLTKDPLEGGSLLVEYFEDER